MIAQHTLFGRYIKILEEWEFSVYKKYKMWSSIGYCTQVYGLDLLWLVGGYLLEFGFDEGGM